MDVCEADRKRIAAEVRSYKRSKALGEFLDTLLIIAALALMCRLAVAWVSFWLL